MKTTLYHFGTAIALATLLAACGGGSEPSASAAAATITVVGDDWADSGYFGYKPTVQAQALLGSDSTPVWPEWVASSYGHALCPRYRAVQGGRFSIQTHKECTNHAVANAQINANPPHPLSDLPPVTSIDWQLEQAGLDGYGEKDVLLVGVGLHDASSLFLTLNNKLAPGPDLIVPPGRSPGGDSLGALQRHAELAGRLLGQEVADAILRNPDNRQQTVPQYMEQLAHQLAHAIKLHALEKGAQRVVLLNMPDVTLLPYLRGQLWEFEPPARRWVDIFNTTLAAAFADDARVMVVDVHGAFTQWMTQPAQYALTNVTNITCPIYGHIGVSRPRYDLKTCTAVYLSAHPPNNEITNGADWWKGYAFADNNFALTPRVHELLGNLVLDALVQAGWR